MVAIAEILREQFEVQSGGILSTGGRALGYNVIDTRYDPTDPRHIVRTFDNAQAAQNYSNEINTRLRSNPNFDPRSPSAPDSLRANPSDRIGAEPTSQPTREKPPVEHDDLTSGQKRRLSRHNSVRIGGFTYTRQEIDDFTELARIRRNQSNRDNSRLDSDSDELKNRRRGAWATRRALSGTLGLSLSLALPVAAYQELQEELRVLANRRYPIPPGEEGHNPDEWENRLTEEGYQVAVGSYFAAWTATWVIPSAIATFRLGARAIIAMLSPIRSAGLAAAAVRQAFSAMTGPGFLGVAAINALILLLTEVGIYIAARVILSSETVQNSLLKFLASWYGQKFAEYMEISYNVIGGAIVNTVDIVSNDDETVNDVRNGIEQFAQDRGGIAPDIDDTATTPQSITPATPDASQSIRDVW